MILTGSITRWNFLRTMAYTSRTNQPASRASTPFMRAMVFGCLAAARGCASFLFPIAPQKLERGARELGRVLADRDVASCGDNPEIRVRNRVVHFDRYC